MLNNISDKKLYLPPHFNQSRAGLPLLPSTVGYSLCGAHPKNVPVKVYASKALLLVSQNCMRSFYEIKIQRKSRSYD